MEITLFTGAKNAEHFHVNTETCFLTLHQRIALITNGRGKGEKHIHNIKKKTKDKD